MPTRLLILASQSPRRRELLAQLGIPFEVVVSAIDEQRLPGEPPVEMARRLSREKAWAVSRTLEHPVLIVAADTIVIDGEDVLGKPRDAEEAAAMLTRLRGHTHTVCTAVSVLDTITGTLRSEAPASPVSMRAYTQQEIADYIATGDPFDKAGGYAIQHQGFHPVESFDHCYANVMGLPICRVARLLQSFDVPLPDHALDSCRVHQTIPCPLFAS